MENPPQLSPQLSQGFFQKLFDDTMQSEMQPILQLLDSRQINGRKQFRLRLSDGLHSYGYCITIDAIFDRYRADQLDSHSSIIQVIKWTCATAMGKMNFIVQDYKVVSLDFPAIGNPVAHSGNPNEHRNQMVAVQQVEDELLESVQNHGTKRGRVSSPVINDPLQPIAKKQPDMSKIKGIIPIRDLTPYQRGWRICGIVSGKDDKIKDISNARGVFRVFGFTVTDQMGDSIRLSAFAETADRIFPIVENGKVYIIAGGYSPNTVKLANKQFNNTGHDYAVTLDRDSTVEFYQDKFDAPNVKFRPIHLANIPTHANECIDVQAVVSQVFDITQVTSRKDKQMLDKRDILLVDQTGTEICFTLWGDQVNNFAYVEGTVIGIKGAIVKQFNGGFSISAVSGTQIVEDPEGPYTQNLYIWYRDRKPLQAIKSISPRTNPSVVFERDFHTIGQIMKHGLDSNNEKGQYLIIKAMVKSFKQPENAVYQACPNKGCKKKLIVEGNQYRCQKCDEKFDNYTSMIMLQMELFDSTGTVWVTIFDDLAQELLRMNAEQLLNLQRENRANFYAVFDNLLFTEFMFRVRVRYETFNDQLQIRWNVFAIKSVPIDQCKKLYENSLQELEQQYPEYGHE